MSKHSRTFLIVAGSMSAIIALWYLWIMLVGEPAYRYFAGIGFNLLIF